MISKKNRLDSVSIFFCSRCNLHCIHCGYGFANNTKKDELPVSVFVNALKEAKELGAISVNITGGEIFIRDDCFDLLDQAFDLGYNINIETNGVLLQDKDIEKLKKYGSRLRVAFSVDGLNKETHERIRGKGTFDKTMNVLKNLSKSDVKVRANTVMQQFNKDQIPDMARYFVEELGVGFRLLPSILEQETKDSCNCIKLEVPYADIEHLLNSFMYDFMRKHKEKDISLSVNIALVPFDIENFMLCPWGKNSLGISYDGTVSLCHNRSGNKAFVFGNLKEKSLKEIWINSDVANFFKNYNCNKLKGVCAKCLAKKLCRGGCRVHAMATYGDIYAPDPFCQKVYELGKFPKYALRDSTCDE